MKVCNGIIPSGLKLKKKPAILPVSVDFKEKWKLVLNEAEKKLVEELLVESEKIIASVETQIELEMKDRNTNDFLRERREIDRNHAQFKHHLEQRRIKKWERKEGEGAVKTQFSDNKSRRRQVK